MRQQLCQPLQVNLCEKKLHLHQQMICQLLKL